MKLIFLLRHTPPPFICFLYQSPAFYGCFTKMFPPHVILAPILNNIISLYYCLFLTSFLTTKNNKIDRIKNKNAYEYNILHA